jgi:hypothetical protein
VKPVAGHCPNCLLPSHQPEQEMKAIAGTTMINIPGPQREDHDILAGRRDSIDKMVPPAYCMREVFRWYKDKQVFKNAMNFLASSGSPQYRIVKDFVTEADRGSPHTCCQDDWKGAGVFLTVIHLKEMKPKLLCFPRLVFPDTPIDTVRLYVQCVQGTPNMSALGRHAPFFSPVWGGMNWFNLAALLVSPSAPPRLRRDPINSDACTPNATVCED